MTQHNPNFKLDKFPKPKQVISGIYEFKRDHLVDICGFEGCRFHGGYLGLPMCEDHAWQAFEILKNDASQSEAKERARQQRIDWDEADRLKEAERELEYAERWKNQTSIEAGFIYYLRVGGLIKIGYTRSIADRLKAYPPHSTLLATHPGTLKVERQMHHKFLHQLKQGREWFEPAEDLLAHIESVKQDFKQSFLVTA